MNELMSELINLLSESVNKRMSELVNDYNYATAATIAAFDLSI